MKVDIRLVLDRSGSMSTVQQDVIGGINKFFEDQRKVKGKARVTMVQFDHNVTTVYVDEKLKNCEDLTDKTFTIGGMTALLDAFGQELKRDRREGYDKTVVVVFTDGYENASHMYTRRDIARLVKEREAQDWEFVFLGADIDAFGEAQDIGIASINTINVSKSSQGFEAAYMSVSSNLAQTRAGTKADMSFEEADYEAQARAGAHNPGTVKRDTKGSDSSGQQGDSSSKGQLGTKADKGTEEGVS